MTLNKQLLRAALYHYAAYVLMQTLALFAELRRGPAIPDLLHDWLPLQPQFHYINSTFWLSGLLLGLGYLALKNKKACINYLRIGAVVSIFRGIFITLTSLGPPNQSHVSSVMKNLELNSLTAQVWYQQFFPIDVLFGGSGYSAAYLSQDLMFSGHTASTFLFLLVLSRRNRIYWLFLMLHCITVSGLLLTHEHYSIDILAAYFVVYAIAAFFKKRGWWLAQEK